MRQPKKFAIFCTNCGSYDIEVYSTLKEVIVFECHNCDTKDEIEQ
jgi:ribosomal protein L44E